MKKCLKPEVDDRWEKLLQLEKATNEQNAEAK